MYLFPLGEEVYSEVKEPLFLLPEASLLQQRGNKCRDAGCNRCSVSYTRAVHGMYRGGSLLRAYREAYIQGGIPGHTPPREVYLGYTPPRGIQQGAHTHPGVYSRVHIPHPGYTHPGIYTTLGYTHQGIYTTYKPYEKPLRRDLPALLRRIGETSAKRPPGFP